MKFFKFLAIAFPIYVALTFLASAVLNSASNLPGIIDIALEIITMSLILVTFPFTPLLKAFGMYVTAYWAYPTASGILLSGAIWEAIFVLAFFFIRKLKSKKA